MTAEGRATVLIVDDSADYLAVLGVLLQPLYRVLDATSGEGALRIAHSLPRPDLILLDLSMPDLLIPDLDGYAVLARLRATRPAATSWSSFAPARPMPATKSAAWASARSSPSPSRSSLPWCAPACARNSRRRRRATGWPTRTPHSRPRWRGRWTNTTSPRASPSARWPTWPRHPTRKPATNFCAPRPTCSGWRSACASTRASPSRAARAMSSCSPARPPRHDIGKVGIPDHVQFKPGALSDAERVVMKTHAQLGSDAIPVSTP